MAKGSSGQRKAPKRVDGSEWKWMVVMEESLLPIELPEFYLNNEFFRFELPIKSPHLVTCKPFEI